MNSIEEQEADALRKENKFIGVAAGNEVEYESSQGWDWNGTVKSTKHWV